MAWGVRGGGGSFLITPFPLRDSGTLAYASIPLQGSLAVFWAGNPDQGDFLIPVPPSQDAEV